MNRDPRLQSLIDNEDWAAAEQLEDKLVRNAQVRAVGSSTFEPSIIPQQLKRAVEPAGWGSCPADLIDLEAAHQAAKFGRPELATQIKDSIDERHARCLAGCAIRDVAGNCVAE